MPERYPWHDWYDQFAGDEPEVSAIQRFEPASLPEWAIGLRMEMPTLPPAGVEMCHARWLETLTRLVEDIGDGAFRRRSHWCGDIPLETVAGMGLRRRVLMAWQQNRPLQDLQNDLIASYGAPPSVAELYFDILGPYVYASPEVRQDVEVMADMLSGPYEAGSAPLVAKWQARLPVLEQRRSVLAGLRGTMSQVITHLCNWRTLEDIDRLIGMVSRQQLESHKLGPCNWSLRFILNDRPETVSATVATVWALHQFAALQFSADTSKVPLGSRDQAHTISKRLGSPDPAKAWLAISLGFLIKKWCRRMWHIISIPVPDTALPEFTFGYRLSPSGRWMAPNAPTVRSSKTKSNFSVGRAPKLPPTGEGSLPSAPPGSSGSQEAQVSPRGASESGLEMFEDGIDEHVPMVGAPKLPPSEQEGGSASSGAPSLPSQEFPTIGGDALDQDPVQNADDTPAGTDTLNAAVAHEQIAGLEVIDDEDGLPPAPPPPPRQGSSSTANVPDRRKQVPDAVGPPESEVDELNSDAEQPGLAGEEAGDGFQFEGVETGSFPAYESEEEAREHGIFEEPDSEEEPFM